MGIFDALLGASRGAVAAANTYRAEQDKEQQRTDALAQMQLNLGLQVQDPNAIASATKALGITGVNTAPHFARQAEAAALDARAKQSQIDTNSGHLALQARQQEWQQKWDPEKFRLEMKQRTQEHNQANAITQRGQDLNYNASVHNAGLDYLAALDRNKAGGSAGGKYITDDQARAIKTITDAVLSTNPRNKDLAGTEEDGGAYFQRVAPRIRAALSKAGLPDIYGEDGGGALATPFAPQTTPTPMATPGPGGQSAPLPQRTPAPQGSPFTPQPMPTGTPSFAPIAPRSVPGEQAWPVMKSLETDYRKAFGKHAVSSTYRSPAENAAHGRFYESFHQHWKALDGTPPVTALESAIQWGVDRNARVLIEKDHVHYEPSRTGYGYVETKRGDSGGYIAAYRAMTGPVLGATPRVLDLLKRLGVKPNEDK